MEKSFYCKPGELTIRFSHIKLVPGYPTNEPYPEPYAPMPPKKIIFGQCCPVRRLSFRVNADGPARYQMPHACQSIHKKYLGTSRQRCTLCWPCTKALVMIYHRLKPYRRAKCHRHHQVSSPCDHRSQSNARRSNPRSYSCLIVSVGEQTV